MPIFYNRGPTGLIFKNQGGGNTTFTVQVVNEGFVIVTSGNVLGVQQAQAKTTPAGVPVEAEAIQQQQIIQAKFNPAATGGTANLFVATYGLVAGPQDFFAPLEDPSRQAYDLRATRAGTAFLTGGLDDARFELSSDHSGRVTAVFTSTPLLPPLNGDPVLYFQHGDGFAAVSGVATSSVEAPNEPPRRIYTFRVLFNDKTSPTIAALEGALFSLDDDIDPRIAPKKEVGVIVPAISADVVTAKFMGNGQWLYYFNGSEFIKVQGSKVLPNSFVVNEAEGSITVIFDHTSTPNVTQLDGSIFTRALGVKEPPTPPPTDTGRGPTVPLPTVPTVPTVPVPVTLPQTVVSTGPVSPTVVEFVSTGRPVSALSAMTGFRSPTETVQVNSQNNNQSGESGTSRNSDTNNPGRFVFVSSASSGGVYGAAFASLVNLAMDIPWASIVQSLMNGGQENAPMPTQEQNQNQNGNQNQNQNQDDNEVNFDPLEEVRPSRFEANLPVRPTPAETQFWAELGRQQADSAKVDSFSGAAFVALGAIGSGLHAEIFSTTKAQRTRRKTSWALGA